MSFSDWYNNENYIRSLAIELEKSGYQTVGLPMPEKSYAPGMSKKIDLPLNPIDWYALIKYSSGYVGERMHPIIVSIHNNIPFVVFDEYGVINRYLGGIIKIHHLLSSKTYLILKRAGLEKQLYSYFEHKKKPSPYKVVNLLQSFDRERCSEFSSLYQIEYEEGMKRVLDIFNKNVNL